jgi:hypothetical protein
MPPPWIDIHRRIPITTPYHTERAITIKLMPGMEAAPLWAIYPLNLIIFFLTAYRPVLIVWTRMEAAKPWMRLSNACHMQGGQFIRSASSNKNTGGRLRLPLDGGSASAACAEGLSISIGEV